MKKNFLILLVCIAGLFTACSKDSDDGTIVNNTTVTSSFISGKWQITHYVDSGQVSTIEFSSFAFTFNSNGTFMAINNILTAHGTWKVTTAENGKTNFTLNFPSPPIFEELNRDWEVTSKTATKISLQESGTSGGTDVLVFERM